MSKGDRLGRRVSTQIQHAFVPRGISRVWHGLGGERCRAGFLPIRPLREVGKLPHRKALSFLAKRVGVPKVRPGQLYLTFDKRGRAIWWLVTKW